MASDATFRRAASFVVGAVLAPFLVTGMGLLAATVLLPVLPGTIGFFYLVTFVGSIAAGGRFVSAALGGRLSVRSALIAVTYVLMMMPMVGLFMLYLASELGLAP